MYTNLLFQSFFYLSDNFLMIIDSDGNFKKVNDKWKELGFSKEELIQTPFVNLIYPEDQAETKNFIAADEFSNTASELKNRLVSQDGDILLIKWRFLKIDSTEDIIAIGKDISDQTRQQLTYEAFTKDLKEKSKKLEDLFELSEDLIVIANADGYFKKVNPKWIEILGYSEAELLSTPFMEFIHPDDRSKTTTMVRKQMEGTTAIKFENRYQTKSGESVWLEWNATSVDQTGDIFAIARNTTAQKKQKIREQATLKEVRAKNKQLEDFAYITSHNLRAPVANIAMLTKFLEETQLSEEQEKLTKLLTDSTRILNQTLHDLIEVIQIHNKDNTKLVEVSLEKIVKEVTNQLSGEIMSSKAEITTDFSDVSIVRYSEIFLRSIFLNLISNALKYKSPDRKPVINITAKRLKNSIQLTFSDNGIGIDLEKYKNQVFGFKKTFHNNIDAKGLGLFMTKSQIEALNGTIKVSSTLEKGTKFTINLNL
ncbi:PAS domain S-box protein [Aquimarina brevivitae]|uniref:histidine kinase n=1 Tax=Aquimarina brevivitae TaxID=323412 RepID=A0A4Q7PJ73_9FLAO|nr:PAS domain S-box protein [Aquimarina brevivitae]RZT00328.1 PAS domain S-box-containing protein [Aquimarina brevivitae]